MHSFNKYLPSASLVQSTAQGYLMEDINIKHAGSCPYNQVREIRHVDIYYLVVVCKHLRWESAD